MKYFQNLYILTGRKQKKHYFTTRIVNNDNYTDKPNTSTSQRVRIDFLYVYTCLGKCLYLCCRLLHIQPHTSDKLTIVSFVNPMQDPAEL